MTASIQTQCLIRGLICLMTAIGGRRIWSEASHESAVEKFYGTGVENYEDFHNGYLNFGLWEDGITRYTDAAENLVHRMGSLLGLNGRSVLLDVGCGMGTQDVYLAQNFGPLSIDALDVTWKHVEHGRRRAHDARLDERVHFHHGTATRLPFPDGHYTHLLSIEAPEHFDTREKFLREAKRVLKPGGVIAMADYVLKREPVSLTDKFLVESARRLWKVPLANVETPESYERKMHDAGFENVSIEEVGRLTIPGYYFEQGRPEIVRQVTQIRGFVAGRLGRLIDVALYKAFISGLVEYVLVRAESLRG
jgi:ubiquinone/menaquinone biosynthesis C-methylase UbiE